MTAVVVGIDPGLTGAIAAVSLAGEFVLVRDLEATRNRSIGWINAQALIEALSDVRAEGRIVTALVEQPAVLRGQGSALTIGATFGSIVACIAMAGAQLQVVTAGQWKAALGLTRDKRQSLDRARQLFPDAPLELKKHHNRAEALCLAWYGARQMQRASSATA